MCDIKKPTAREHCAARRAAPFGAYRLAAAGEPSWRKLGGGYLGICDGSARQYVLPGHVFAVEIHDGKPEIRRYLRAGDRKPKAYTLGSLRRLLNAGDFPGAWKSEPVDFDTMCEEVYRAYPGIDIPTEFAFWAEYGCRYDRATKIATAYVDLREDD